MPKTIPPGARTLHIPNLGEIAIFMEGASWLAVYVNSEDVQPTPMGSGPTPVEAVADLFESPITGLSFRR